MITVLRMVNYIKRFKNILIYVVVFATLSSLFSMAAPILVGMGVDNIVAKGRVDFKSIFYIILILVVIYIMASLFQWLMGIFISILSNKVAKALRDDTFDSLSIVSLQYFDTGSYGDVISRLTNDIDTVTEGLIQGTTQLFSGAVLILGSFGFMLYLSPIITVIVLVITPVSFAIASFVTKRSNKMFKQQSKLLGQLNGYVEEILSNQRIVKAFSYEKETQNKFKEINEKLYYCGRDAQFYSSLTNPSTRFVNNISYIAVGVVGGIAAISGKITVGRITSFLSYATQFAKPINEITSVLWQIQAAIAAAQRVFDVMNQDAEPQDNSASVDMDKCKGQVACQNVYFSYTKEVPLIEDFNIFVKPGSTIAIVGPTGAGKTTLINLIMRFYEINKGEIKIDGISIKHLTRYSLRQMFGMVLQETWLFKGTVKENIAYGNPDATDEEIINAAKSANAHGFIKRLENGYDTIIEEDGENLSQGQKQLLTIARAMLKNAPILILDEATSNVDIRTEIKIQKAFLNIMKGKTSFVIAHRLSTIKEADLILVMDKGKVVEQGKHAELLSNKGLYYKLYNSQFAND